MRPIVLRGHGPLLHQRGKQPRITSITCMKYVIIHTAVTELLIYEKRILKSQENSI